MYIAKRVVDYISKFRLRIFIDIIILFYRKKKQQTYYALG